MARKGRGWWGEPGRHADAARGIKTGKRSRADADFWTASEIRQMQARARTEHQAWKDAQRLAGELRGAGYGGFASDIDKAVMETNNVAALARKLAKTAQSASEWLAAFEDEADLTSEEFDSRWNDLVGPIADLAEELGAKVEY